MSIAVLGSGAFGTALAIALSATNPVHLWSRNPEQAKLMANTRINGTRLPGVFLPENIKVTGDLTVLKDVDIFLIAVPMQKLSEFLNDHKDALTAKTLVLCCKGIDLKTGRAPLEIAETLCPKSPSALLTGPSFAADIAKGLPTALTLACSDPDLGAVLQAKLSNATLRLYRTTDVVGASLGGAMKNVIAIACGAAIGAGLGESARAALMTRGNAEMQRLATHMGADPATLFGLSGFGDLVLTCTSTLSRNYRYGVSIGEKSGFDPTTTVEGAATARAIALIAAKAKLDMPITAMVAALVEKRLDVADVMTALLSRSLKEE